MADLTPHDRVVIKQVREMIEVFTDWETANKYAIQSANGSTLLFAAERGGAGAMVVRALLKAARPFALEAVDAAGATQVVFRRPWTWWMSRLEVLRPDGAVLGTVQQRFTLLGRRYAVLDARGQELGRLDGSLFRPWTFKFLRDGSEIGRIAKQWGGLTREVFTDADRFEVRFAPDMDADARLVFVGAAMLIDFRHFEDRG